MARLRKKPNTGSHFMKNKNGGGYKRIEDGQVINCDPALLGKALDKFEILNVKAPTPVAEEKKRVPFRDRKRRKESTPTPVEDEPVETPEETEEPEVAEGEDLTMVHKGGGRWQVLRVDSMEPVHEGFLTKKEAAALVYPDKAE